MASVTLSDVTKAYGAVAVIPKLNLQIADREFVVLVGPSGCGKTTALRMIAGLETASGGHIQIGGRDVTLLQPGQRNCAMVFQNYALYPHMTVGANIGYGMRVRGHARDEVASAVDRAARVVGLEKLLDRKPKDLSGGQRQRVAIARALVRDPDVFLFDEPLSNLDAKLRVEMRSEIRRLHQRLEATMVYVTHDQVEAMTLADRVVVMNAGRIEQAADPMTLYEDPANMFVAGFIGAPSMNFLDGTVVRGLAGISLRFADDLSISVDGDLLTLLNHYADRHVKVGLRPEHVRQAPEPSGISFRIDTVEPLGSHKLALGYVAGQPFSAQLPANFSHKPGEVIHLAPEPGRLHLFDPVSGRSLRAS